MKLKQIQFTSPTWSLDNIRFDDVSLIVGKNAVGKSRTIDVLNELVDILLQKRELKEYDTFGYTITYYDQTNELTYSFNYYGGAFISESLTDKEGREYIRRNAKETIFFEESINPPANKLTIHVRRDTQLYPFVEQIFKWAENSYGILFNMVLPMQGSIDIFKIMSKCEDLITMFEKLDDKSKQEIREELNAIHYPITKMEVVEIGDKSALKVLQVEEEGVNTYLWQGLLSQGMLRSVFLLVLLNYIATRKEESATLVIDDFCEGLDYDRAIQLGKYVYNFCLQHQIQLIATSNDNFLMDVVDLKYWNILQREGTHVTAINRQNTPELFDDFEFTGLSNFDLFSSDFIARHKK